MDMLLQIISINIWLLENIASLLLLLCLTLLHIAHYVALEVQTHQMRPYEFGMLHNHINVIRIFYRNYGDD